MEFNKDYEVNKLIVITQLPITDVNFIPDQGKIAGLTGSSELIYEGIKIGYLRYTTTTQIGKAYDAPLKAIANLNWIPIYKNYEPFILMKALAHLKLPPTDNETNFDATTECKKLIYKNDRLKLHGFFMCSWNRIEWVLSNVQA